MEDGFLEQVIPAVDPTVRQRVHAGLLGRSQTSTKGGETIDNSPTAVAEPVVWPDFGFYGPGVMVEHQSSSRMLLE
jgi:hypothetical protein